jgi:hypothetical protein
VKTEPMTLADLIQICRAWTHLGWAVESQLGAVLDEEPIEKQNPAAMEIALHHLRVVIEQTSETEAVHEEAYDLAADIEQCLDEAGTRRCAIPPTDLDPTYGVKPQGITVLCGSVR